MSTTCTWVHYGIDKTVGRPLAHELCMAQWQTVFEQRIQLDCLFDFEIFLKECLKKALIKVMF